MGLIPCLLCLVSGVVPLPDLTEPRPAKECTRGTTIGLFSKRGQGSANLLAAMLGNIADIGHLVIQLR